VAERRYATGSRGGAAKEVEFLALALNQSLNRLQETQAVEYSNTVRQFIIDNFLFGEETEIPASASFLEEGIIDSTGVLELIGFLEETYEINVEDEELTPENLDSLNNIVDFLQRKVSDEANKMLANSA
jgi:acyl carrier protein